MQSHQRKEKALGWSEYKSIVINGCSLTNTEQFFQANLKTNFKLKWFGEDCL